MSEKVLVVDDDQDAADSLAVALDLRGYFSRVAYDGPRAIEVARQWWPDVVVLDLAMPHMTGLQTARRLRQLAGCKHVRLIALTGFGQPRDAEAVKVAGFDVHLVKPVPIDDVVRAIAVASR